jgi:membrane protein YdbS with pleckstrin-like domain
LDDVDAMTTLHAIDTVQQDRQIVWETYPSWAQFSWLYLLSAVSALRGAMFFRVGVGGWELWIIGTGLLLCCAVILRRWAHYELTRERIIVRNGYTGREIHSVPLRNVRTVTVEQGVIAGFFGIGMLTISSPSMDRMVSLRGIRDPEDVKIRIEAAAWRESRRQAEPPSE